MATPAAPEPANGRWEPTDGGGPALLITTSSAFEAQVIQARLRAEGLDPELQGAVEGPYVFTVGSMGEVSIHVPQDQLADARLVLLATEIDESVGWQPPAGDGAAPGRGNWSRWLTIAAVLATLVLVTVARMAAAS